jgi:hypothetical protein
MPLATSRKRLAELGHGWRDSPHKPGPLPAEGNNEYATDGGKNGSASKSLVSLKRGHLGRLAPSWYSRTGLWHRRSYGRSQATEYGNLEELVQMYVDVNGTFSQ